MGSNQSNQKASQTTSDRIVGFSNLSPPPATNPSFTPSAPPSAPVCSPHNNVSSNSTLPKLLFPGLYGKSGHKPSTFEVIPVVSEDNSIEVHAVYGRDAVLKGVTNQGHALLQIKTNDLPEQAIRPPFELCVVLDVSGSMSGPRLDTAKKTIVHIVESLEPNDTLHFVTYATTSSIIFRDGKASNKAALLQQVERVTATGSTNLWGGLSTATGILESTKERSEGIRSLFLFSDGHANAGSITTAHAFKDNVPSLAARGAMTISSFGIGTGFDQAVMEGISEVGEGQYCYLETPDQIEEKVGLMLQGLTHALATDVRVCVSGLNGCVVKHAHGYTNDQLMMGLSVGSLQSNNVKNIVLEVEISADGNVKEGTEVEILKWEMKYNQQERPNQQLKGSITTQITEDRDALLFERQMVMTEIVLLEVAEKDRELQEALERRELQKAKEIQQSNCLLLADTGVAALSKNAAKMALRQDEQLEAMNSNSEASWDVGHFLKKTGQRRFVSKYNDERCYDMM